MISPLNAPMYFLPPPDTRDLLDQGLIAVCAMDQANRYQEIKFYVTRAKRELDLQWGWIEASCTSLQPDLWKQVNPLDKRS